MIRVVPQMYTIGENMHPSPDAETPNLNSNWWGMYWNCPRAFDTTDTHSGAQSVKYTRNRNDVKQGAICQTQRAVSHGGTYMMSAWVKSDAGRAMRITGRLVNTNGTAFSEGAGAVAYTASGAWEYKETLPFTLGTKPYTLGLIVINDTATDPVGVVIWIDDVRIWRVS